VQSTAKAGAQAATLQSFGKAFIDYSITDSNGQLTSSAFDHFRDGDATKVGWVADIVNGKFGNPTKSLDPVNRLKINEKFTDLAGTSASGGLNNFRWLSQVVNRPSDGVRVTERAQATGTGYFGTDQTVWDSGYNSNFCTTWHFSRGDNNITTGDLYNVNASALDAEKSPLDGDGPLSAGILADPTFVSTADKIALMGPSRAGDSGDSTVGSSGNNTAQSINLFIDPTGRKSLVKVGDFTVESFTDGPSASRNLPAVGGMSAAGVYAGDSNAQVHEINDIVPNCKAKKINTSFGQLIAGGYANLVFADGSCRRVNDNNGYGGANKGDSWIGPYPANPSGTARNNFVFDAGAYDETRDEIYLGRLRSRLTAGGGSVE
jgi:prepilin-type processing-associated H-X9-DG protein